jgi:hypothetical protein
MIIWNKVDWRLGEHMLKTVMQFNINELQARAIVTKALLNLTEVKEN